MRTSGRFSKTEGIRDQKDRTESDCHVSHVECGKVPVVPVQIDEVDHVAEPQPVNQVAYRTGQNQGQPPGQQAIAVADARLR